MINKKTFRYAWNDHIREGLLDQYRQAIGAPGETKAKTQPEEVTALVLNSTEELQQASTPESVSDALQVIHDAMQNVDKSDLTTALATMGKEKAKAAGSYLGRLLIEGKQEPVEQYLKIIAAPKPPRSVALLQFVTNFRQDQDNYYAKFVANNGVNDFGYWQETIGPGVSPGLNKSTMPHVLLCTGTNTFTFGERDYTDRNVGDDITNKHPSFVGKTIQQAFFHSNRLGFLTEDNVSMSKAADPFNFYHTTARTITDGDPVDLSATSVRPALLHAVRPTTQGLVLFSKSQQFLMPILSGQHHLTKV